MVDNEHTDKTMEDAEDIEMTGDDNAYDIDLVDAEENSNTKLKDLRNRLKMCEAEKMEHLEQLQRAKAEFLNARKRFEDDKLEAKERAVDRIVEQLLPMYDSFALAMADTKRWDAIDANWRKGVEAIYGQLKSLLQSYNVSEINPKGTPFDPEHHEAMGYEEVTDDSQHDTVVKVLQAGFVRNQGEGERTIRPARVIVGNYIETN